MATLAVIPNKTTYTAGEQITVVEVVSGLAPGTPSTTESDTLTGTSVLSTGQTLTKTVLIDVTTPGTPAETVVDYTLTSSRGRTFVENPVGTFKATA